jgi:LuxR family maltose regulon positive regulatory protein
MGAETDRPVLPFAMTDSRQLLMALPSHDTAHAALLAEVDPVVDAIAGTSRLRPGKQRRDGCKLAVGRSR